MRRHRYLLCSVSIVAVALFVRAAQLDLRPYHHDEAIHAYDSYRISLVYDRGLMHEHHYDPTYHGPLLYYVTGAAFAIAGDSDVVGRALPVACGVLLVMALLAFRAELTDGGAIVGALLVAVSPVQIYYARFLRNDVFMALFTLLFFGLYYRGVRQRRTLPGLLGVAMLALAFTAKESAYIVAFTFAVAVSMLGVFAVLCRIGPLGRLMARGRGPSRLRLLLGHARDVAGEHAGMVQGLFVLLGFATFNLLGGLLADFDPWGRAVVAAAVTTTIATVAMTLLVLHAQAEPGAELARAAAALRGPLLGVGVFALLFSLAYSNAFIHPERLGDGLFSALEYWTGQQRKPRLDGPFLYYLPLLLLHEPVSLMVPIVAALGSARRWLRMLLLAAVGGSAATLVAATAGGAVARLDDLVAAVAAGRSLLDVTVAIAIAVLFVGAAFRSFVRGDVPLSFCWLWALLSFLLYAWAREKVPWLAVHVALPFTILTALLLRSARPAVRAAVVAVALLLAAHSRYLTVATHECNVADPLVYVQTVARVRPVVAEMRRALDRGVPLTIQSDVTVPFYWYLRGYPTTFPKKVEGEAAGGLVLAELGKGGAAALPERPRRMFYYYAWQVPEWGARGMGLEGLGALCDWLPSYLLHRDQTPFRRGGMQAEVLWPVRAAPEEGPEPDR